jgi:hypothetical protein
MNLRSVDSATLTGCSFSDNSAGVYPYASCGSSVWELCFVCVYMRWRCHIQSQPACMRCVCQAASHVMHAGTAKTTHQMHECCACCKPPISAPGAPASECCTALSIWVHEMRTVVDVQYQGGAMNIFFVHSATLTGCSFSDNSVGVLYASGVCQLLMPAVCASCVSCVYTSAGGVTYA